MKLPAGSIRKALPLGIGYGALVLGQILLARGAGPELFGRFSLVMAWVNVGVLLAIAGFQFSATKVLPPLVASGAWGAVRFAIATMARSVATQSAVAAAFLLLAVATDPFNLAPARLSDLWPALLLVPLIALSHLRVAVASAVGRLWTGQIPDNILRPFAIGGSVLILSRLAVALDVRLLLVIVVMAYGLSTVVGSFFAWRALPAPGGDEYHGPGIRAELRKVGYYMGVMNVLIGCAKSLDIVIVGALVRPGDLAVYVAVTRIADVVNLIYVIADPIFLPRFAASGQAPAGGLLVQDVNAYQSLATAWSLVCIAAVLGGGGLMLQTFGPSYEQGWRALLIASVGQSVNAWTGPGAQLLTFLGQGISLGSKIEI